MKGKVTKIMVWPTRKVNLGNYNTAEMSAGIEISFEKPVDSDSKDVKEAFDEARKLVREELKKQYEPYETVMKVNKGQTTGGE